MERFDRVIIGAGLAGLGAAVEAHERGERIRIFEASPRVGGVVQTEASDGYRFERGPNAFRIHADARLWLASHGLLDIVEPAGPEARKRALFLDGRLLWLPDSPLGLVTTPLLSGSAKLRALGELFRKAGEAETESVAEFIARRFGPELVARAVAPFLVGVYAGDERELGARAVFPKLVAWEREYGSVLGGVLRNLFARGPKGLRGSHSAEGGVAAFAATLAERVTGALALATSVEALERSPDGFRIVTSSGMECFAARVLLCAPAAEARTLIAPLDEEAARRVAAVEYAPIVSVALGVDPADYAEPIRGFGYLIPREAELSLLGTLFPSRVFAGRAPAGHELLHAMIGGKRWPGAVDADDEIVLGRIEEGLERTLGARNIGQVLALIRWPRAVPQPGRRHIPEIAELRSGLAKRCPGLSLAGSYLDGVSVADTLMSGVNAVRSG